MESLPQISITPINDVMSLVSSFLSRKKKYSLCLLSKQFREQIVPLSMVSLSFRGGEAVLESELLRQCVKRCRKVEKLQFESIEQMDLEYVSKMQEILSSEEGAHFLRRVRHLTYKNLKFGGPDLTEVQKSFAIGKFCQCIALFSELESIEFENVSCIFQIVKFLNKISQDDPQRIKFAKTLTLLNISACHIPEEDQDEAFVQIKDLSMNLPQLERLQLKGLRIGEKIGDLVSLCKNSQLKELSLELNGIEPDFCLYFRMILNMETLQHLNLSQNWIGMLGLEHLRDCLAQAKNLKILNLSSNKLCLMPDRRTETLVELLKNVRLTMEELDLSQNSIEDEDFGVIIDTLAQMPKLKYLRLDLNRISALSFGKFIDVYIDSMLLNKGSLETLLIKQNQLFDEGLQEFFSKAQQLPNLSHVKLSGNRNTLGLLPYFVKFIENFDCSNSRSMVVDFTTKGFLRPKEREEFITSVKEAIVKREIQLQITPAATHRGLFKVDLI
ncbi:hypothetical protein FGO68_gene9274 [Halteria grandinella]|uniref:Uncharacterized protein n=1 Tax=Halteria grandinella TaxID=5974 RepID=A0A8J8NR27_HALGN|nr:hypothetical protein FGO68_gene9274 [Halteria grandinella]